MSLNRDIHIQPLKLIFCVLYGLSIHCDMGGYPSDPTQKEGQGVSQSLAKSGIYFKQSSNNNYGFDALSTSYDAYINVQTSNNTSFIANVSNHPKDASTSPLSPNITLSPTALTNGKDNEVQISATSSYGANEAQIFGCTGQSSSNPCYVVENSLHVKVYDKRSISFTVSLWNNSSASTKGLSTFINNVFKQGVCHVTCTPNDFSYADKTQWDKNKNGILDYFWPDVNNSVPVQLDELEDLMTYAQNNSIGTSGSPGIVILDNPIRTHVELQYKAYAKSVLIYLNATKHDILEKTYIHIGPFPGQKGDEETVYVQQISSDKKTLTIQQSESNFDGLMYDHDNVTPNYHTVWQDGRLKAACVIGTDFIFGGSNIDNRGVTHELLHAQSVGPLHHVSDKDNMMYPYDDATDNMLRYRDLSIIDAGVSNPESQWKILSKNSQ